MNTLQYFLATLRPAPPPSPRASTSELPIPRIPSLASSAPLHHDGARHAHGGAALDDDAHAAGDAQREAGEKERPGSLRRASTTSRKGKARLDPAPPGAIVGVAHEDPLRDGATVRTEVERGEGVEGAFVSPSPSSPAPSPDGAVPDSDAPPPATAVGADAQLPTPPPSPIPSSSSLPPSPHSEPTLPAPAPSPSFPFLTRLFALPLAALPLPLRLLATPAAGLVVLLRRFLALFGLVEPPRPGWNALVVPPTSKASASEAEKGALVPSAASGRSGEEEGGKRARLVSLALSFSSSARASPPPSPSPSPLSHPAPSIPRPLAPPKLTPKTLVLDLDETLIHSTSRPYRASGLKGGRGRGLRTKVVEVVLDGRSTVYTVYKRPWVDFFLRKVSSWYTVIIFTASLPEYADPVIDWLDGGDGRGGMVGGRLFRAHCLSRNGTYVKDLSVVDPDLSRVCLVDNSPASYAVNQANGIPIEGWINDPSDECLLDLLPMLDSLRFTGDVRRVLGLRGFGRAGGGVAGARGRGFERDEEKEEEEGVSRAPLRFAPVAPHANNTRHPRFSPPQELSRNVPRKRMRLSLADGWFDKDWDGEEGEVREESGGKRHRTREGGESASTSTFTSTTFRSSTSSRAFLLPSRPSLPLPARAPSPPRRPRGHRGGTRMSYPTTASANLAHALPRWQHDLSPPVPSPLSAAAAAAAPPQHLSHAVYADSLPVFAPRVRVPLLGPPAQSQLAPAPARAPLATDAREGSAFGALRNWPADAERGDDA
ncbi:hypothetical protein JCM10207_008583 [Rhodosporidiobolus poonsookiae]